MANNILTVTEVNNRVKSLICNDFSLKNIQVKGEISNFKVGPNGHLYFSIKDENSMINVMMFNFAARSLVFTPKNGDEVVLLASVDVYTPRGTYQLICTSMFEVGRGNALLELEELKKKLAKEGLFDPSRKRPVTLFPKSIGVITGRNSAAIKDILFNLKRRYPIADVYVFYASVQGDKAASELLEAFNKSQEYDLDTLIIGRGGGASEDLSAFNDETLVRAIANSKMPTIAAVGHEIDSTLVDFVCDKRASTPTGAAELATIDVRELQEKFIFAQDDMKQALIDKISALKEDIASYKDDLYDELTSRISELKKEIKVKKEYLNSINPKSILKRGYSITTNESGDAITDANQINENDVIITHLYSGKVISEVKRKEDK